MVLLGAVLWGPWPAFAQEGPVAPPMDTESVSCGRVNRGGLAAAAALEPAGPGFVIPEPWRTRGLRYGTEELVEMISKAAAAVERVHPGARLGVADLSSQQGGSAPNHRSHQAGRDVDLIYYALDDSGEPMEPGGCMPSYGADRRASFCHYPEERQVAQRRFDVARNWTLVKALLTNGRTQVRAIFTSLGIRGWLLEHAAHLGEPRSLIRLARRTLMRPPRGRAHTDHMHVRIGCTLDDRRRGRCRNDPSRLGRFFGRLRCPRHRRAPAQVVRGPR